MKHLSCIHLAFIFDKMEDFILFIWIPVGSCCIFVVRGRIVEIQAMQG